MTTREMLKKILTKSGRRLLKAIKKLSTKNRSAKKSQSSLPSVPSWSLTIPDHEAMSLSWSLASLDTRSVDTYVTYINESAETDSKRRCSCCCKEYEQNQRNENRENEMII